MLTLCYFRPSTLTNSFALSWIRPCRHACIILKYDIISASLKFAPPVSNSLASRPASLKFARQSQIRPASLKFAPPVSNSPSNNDVGEAAKIKRRWLFLCIQPHIVDTHPVQRAMKKNPQPHGPYRRPKDKFLTVLDKILITVCQPIGSKGKILHIHCTYLHWKGLLETCICQVRLKLAYGFYKNNIEGKCCQCLISPNIIHELYNYEEWCVLFKDKSPNLWAWLTLAHTF